jgi:hypothetical protein
MGGEFHFLRDTDMNRLLPVSRRDGVSRASAMDSLDRKTDRNPIGYALWLFVFCCMLFAALSSARATNAGVQIDYRDDAIKITAEDTPLSQLLSRLAEVASLTITGLDDRLSETITFNSPRESLGAAVKRLLRQLSADNYAFEYSGARLTRVVVLPASKETGVPIPTLQETTTIVSAVKVVSMVKGTQAQAADLREGDLVLSYNGIDISVAQQLVSEVEKTSDTQTVDMMVVRDGYPVRVILKGGLIGINVQTVKLSKEELAQYRSQAGK